MASPVTHFTHQTPNHYMKLINTDTNFECGACKAPGTGRAYKCQSCTFTLHRSCESSEPAITFFMHPKHALTLLTEHSHLVMNPVTCKLCGERVTGMWYRCATCDFDVHPVCVHIPQFVTDPVHLNGAHRMRCCAGNLGWCDVCGEASKDWHYRCDGCDFDSHFECLQGPPGSGGGRGKKRKIEVVAALDA